MEDHRFILGEGGEGRMLLFMTIERNVITDRKYSLGAKGVYAHICAIRAMPYKVEKKWLKAQCSTDEDGKNLDIYIQELIDGGAITANDIT